MVMMYHYLFVISHGLFIIFDNDYFIFLYLLVRYIKKTLVPLSALPG